MPMVVGDPEDHPPPFALESIDVACDGFESIGEFGVRKGGGGNVRLDDCGAGVDILGQSSASFMLRCWNSAAQKLITAQPVLRSAPYPFRAWRTVPGRTGAINPAGLGPRRCADRQ